MRQIPPTIDDTPLPWKYRDRRSYPRQRRLIRVLVIPQDHVVDEPYGAWLVDSSPGGLRLAIGSEAIPEGAILKVRPLNAAPGGVWTTVCVRNRSQAQNQFELGCQIVRRSGMPVQA